MPIDPKKFKKIITNHFDDLSEEEFLETLRKSSPYIFDGSLEADHDETSSDRCEINSVNVVTELSPISNPGNDREFVTYLREEADRMKSDNRDPISIRSYVGKQKLIYTLITVIQSVMYLTEKITRVFTKRA
jgi:uncharacterized protein YutE (UPF0331/DUF86 family)